MKKIIYFASILILLSCKHNKDVVNVVDYVNPLMGTESTFEFSNGNTYPAVAVPWGMNFWSPQTGENRSGWMYMYTDTLMRGFRQTHQPSPWMNDYGTFAIMPLSEDLKLNHKDRLVAFNHANEKATAYSYKVKFNNGLETEVSATSRASIFEVSYPSEKAKYLVLDAYDGGSSIEIDKENRQIKGFARNNSGGVPDNFANYFVVELSHPILEYGVYNGDSVMVSTNSIQDNYTCGYVQCDVPEGEVLTVRVASSFISPEMALQNLNREVAGKTLDQVKADAKQLWNDYMSRIEVEGGTDDQLKTFYSCLYRTLLFPREFFEYNEKGDPVYYSPYDGKVHNGYMYTDNGFWDTFRAVHPMFTLLYPEISERVTQSIINAYNQSGFMPEWASPGHRGCMIGNNSISLLTDAWMKGIRTVDQDKVLEAMIKQVSSRHKEIASTGRDGFAYYDSLGYVPYPEVHEATAKTLEYAYADWCLARFAEAAGKTEIADKYYKKAQNYRNLYYPENGFMWAKNAKGEWKDNFDATEWGGPFTEGSSWHWTWSVFHDPEGLSTLIGGHDKMVHQLDSMFVAPNTFNYGTYGFVIHEIAEMVALNMGQYAHGNQPVQHAIYLYNYLGQPWKTQYHIRNVMNKLYNSGTKGYCGDEDNGQTSAWYVFSSMGFYPVCPGMPEYVIGSPLFSKVKMNFPNGKTFQILADNNTDSNVYIKDMSLNGESYNKNFILHNDLINGGEIKLIMDSIPNMERGTEKASFPYSYSASRR